MLHVFVGTNARSKMNGLLDKLRAENLNSELFRLTPEVWHPAALEEYLGAQGLFGGNPIVILDGLLAEEEVRGEIMQKLDVLAESSNIFALYESALLKEDVKKLARHADVVTAEEKESVKKPEFNIFSLADALGARDKKLLWILLWKAKRHNLEDEHIHGTLFWIVKAMHLASGAKNASEAGLSPFVFSKAARFVKNYSRAELRILSQGLIETYHNSRRGFFELGQGIERFVLNI